jgi:signal transduction histidine kinase
LVRSFVELHGGGIVIDSNVGEGTKVTCLFPLVRAAGPVARPTVRQIGKSAA